MRAQLMIRVLTVLCGFGMALSAQAAPLGNGVTYQGQIKADGLPINDPVDLRFTLWDAEGSGSPPVGGSQIGASQLLANVAVANGQFTVPLNAGGQFGADAFSGEARWLQVEVCADAGCGTLTVLSPRQPLTAAPYAMTSLTALSTVGIDGHSLDAADGSPTDALFVNDTGRVGIGTTAPDNTLHVHKGSAGVVTAHGNAPLVVENSTHAYINLLTPDANERGLLFGSPTAGAPAGGVIYNSAATPDGLQFRTNGNVNRMVIDSSGNVGIGTTGPGAKLVVNGPENSSPANGVLQVISPGGLLGNIMTFDGNEINGWSHLHINPDATTDIMMVEGGGSVGIGTGAPEARLHVVGGTDSSPAGGGYLVTGNATSTNISIDNNEIMARNNGVPSALFLNNNGGDVVFGGAIDIGHEVITDSIATGFYLTALCSAGKRVLGGGCSPYTYTEIFASRPSGSTGWYCLWNNNNNEASKSAYAICANVK